jgi:hypothetical protein
MRTLKQVKKPTKDGQVAGAWLSERAPHVLLLEYGNRKVDEDSSEATATFTAAIDQLTRALGGHAQQPVIADALHKLDGAAWDLAVEHEDRAWHAAWTLAMQLRGK